MKLPCYCPSCGGQLKVKNLLCEECNTEVSGKYELPIISLLTPEEQQFVFNFVKQSGSLKEMSKQMSLSYPTVRNYLNDIIDKIETYERQQS